MAVRMLFGSLESKVTTRFLLAPAMVGNVVIWKPSPAALYSNYIVYQILTEAGLPPGVIQFVPGPAAEVVTKAISSPDFASLHFTGSTFVFKTLWKNIAANIDIYKSYPRIVGETGGKNFHLIHPSADIENAVNQTIRAAYEYQGLIMISQVLLHLLNIVQQDKNVLLAHDYMCLLRFGRTASRINFYKVSPRSKLAPLTTSEISWALSCVFILRQNSKKLIQSSGKPAFEKITGYIEGAKKEGQEILIGGNCE